MPTPALPGRKSDAHQRSAGIDLQHRARPRQELCDVMHRAWGRLVDVFRRTVKLPLFGAESLCRASLSSGTMMLLTLLRAKIHGAIVTQANRDYVGSITIDRDLLKQSGLLANEKVLVADINNGVRFETYIIVGAAGSGVIGINGAAAHLVKPGEKLIIMAFAQMTPEEATSHQANVLIVDGSNKPMKTMRLSGEM